MFVGKVVGTVWSTVKWPKMGGHKLLLVRPYHLGELLANEKRRAAPVSAAVQSERLEQAQTPAKGQARAKSEEVVCIDLLDAGIGDDVVVAFGHAARVAAQAESLTPSLHGSKGSAKESFSGRSTVTPIDAAIVAIVDGYSLLQTELLDETVTLDGTT
jgi:microcompartment protein CcmK/EutM